MKFRFSMFNVKPKDKHCNIKNTDGAILSLCCSNVHFASSLFPTMKFIGNKNQPYF